MGTSVTDETTPSATLSKQKRRIRYARARLVLFGTIAVVAFISGGLPLGILFSVFVLNEAAQIKWG
jgi:hypothetical protein